MRSHRSEAIDSFSSPALELHYRFHIISALAFIFDMHKMVRKPRDAARARPAGFSYRQQQQLLLAE